MAQFQASDKGDLIWAVADLLRGDYKQSDYGKVILPMTVLRRLDCVLSGTKEKVLGYLPKVEKLSDSAKDVTLNKIAGHNFHLVFARRRPPAMLAGGILTPLIKCFTFNMV